MSLSSETKKITTTTPTFEEPFLSRITEALEEAVSVSWDTCHKIYVAMDQKSHEQQVEYGYDTVLVKDVATALSLLYEWWEDACGLRFINSIRNGSVFSDLIPQFKYDAQFEYDDEEDDDA